MSFFSRIRCLFSRIRSRSTREHAAADIDRRQRVKRLNPIAVACRANGLCNDDRRRVFAHFERMGPVVGLGEASRQAINLAADLSRQRRASRSATWQPPTAA